MRHDRRKLRGAAPRTRAARRRYAARRARAGSWQRLQLDLRTFAWLSRRLGRMVVAELRWRYGRRPRSARR